ncbi:hypothetical protein [Streptococcus mutans]|uniref:hypothetical protein n=1 Tax=Streptococcus mutans TaxID=1309 RepID=UPI001425E40B|nr:hypothetical protein [Streptococcus mutans]QIQ93132.1 hypothetical protein HB753_00825 [Streptococcus mutans]QIQ99373.1 hypothetical protein HB752_00825 [Streptococcus mutans]QIR02849.1 hypothetical protein HB751_09690 [Streptococcus mutans]QIR03152.1 hypothetical protein HB750_00825 [Streptococcus mutans]
MAFIPFKKSNKCLVTDDLFLEITWEEGKSPEDDSELLGIIEGLDQQHLDTFQHPIEESLPYVTFLQAELLFKSLQDAYGQLQLNRVAICHLEGKEVVSEGEVFASPFVIDENYQNLLLPLIQAILTDPEFQSYTYTEKREYFVNQIYPAYKVSLGIQESSLPLFPVEGEQVSSVTPTQKQVYQTSVTPTQPVVAPSVKESSLKKVYVLLGLLGVLAAGGIISSMMAFSQLSKQSEQVTYLYQELKDTKSLINMEHQVDVFNRYFLPTYYSGNKKALSEYLSDGDAKFTVPKDGTLQSVILEKMTYDPKTKEYRSTYVLSVKHDEPSNVRLTFNVKVADSKKGFVVTTEPKESNYIK